MNGKYHITYQAKRSAEGIAKEEVPPEHGACDELLFVSIIHTAGGASSTLFSGTNGVTGEASSDETWFKTWSLLARRLSESETLSEEKKRFCAAIFEMIREAILSARAKGN